MTERWLPIPGFDGLYDVSDLGRVRSVDRVQTYERVRRGVRATVRRRLAGRILRPGTMESGHKVVALGREAGTFLVHILVLTSFVGPCPEGMEGLHGDGDPANNCLSNLRWGTRSDNIQDAIRHGTFPIGERHHAAKLTAADIPVIRARLLTDPMPEIARDYGVNRAVIRQIKIGKTWKHIPENAA